VPRLRGMGQGDQHVKVVVVTPTNLTEEQKELLRQFAQPVAGKRLRLRRQRQRPIREPVRADETGVPRRVRGGRLLPHIRGGASAHYRMRGGEHAA